MTAGLRAAFYRAAAGIPGVEITDVVVGTNAAAPVLPRLAEQLAALRRQRTEIAVVIEKLVEDHPLSPVLTSMPGVGVRTAARLLTEVAGKHFQSSGHLAAYAGLAPVTRRSGSSIRGEHPVSAGQQNPQTGPVPVSFRGAARPGLANRRTY